MLAAIGSLVASVFLGLFTVSEFQYGPAWLTGCVLLFCLGLAITGLYLIRNRHSALPIKARLLMLAFSCLIVSSPIILDFHIRHDRMVLQEQTKNFLLRPIPSLLIPDPEGRVGECFVDPSAGPQNGIFGYSRVLMTRFAFYGRIRWSARIQAEFAVTSHAVNGNFLTEEIEKSEDVRRYFADRNAILGRIWAMGYWQFIEDAIEFAGNPPEHQEEDEGHGYVRKCEGVWTNAISERLDIEPDNTFSLKMSGRQFTNNYRGDWIPGFGKPSLAFLFNRADGPDPSWSPGDTVKFQISQVDDHILIYQMGSRTNSLSR